MDIKEFPNITGEKANLILLDIGQGITVDESKRLKYGKEEKAFRKSVELDWATYHKKHPDAQLDIRE